MSRSSALLPLLHQGGWDEILLVALPLAVVVGLLVLANRRVEARLRDRDETSDGDEVPTPSGPSAG